MWIGWAGPSLLTQPSAYGAWSVNFYVSGLSLSTPFCGFVLRWLSGLAGLRDLYFTGSALLP